MRVMSVAAFFCAAGFGIVTLLYPADEETGAYITFGFFLAAFAPKAPQKFAEETIVAQVSSGELPARSSRVSLRPRDLRSRRTVRRRRQ